MPRVNVNNFGLRYAIESSLGVAPTSGWRSLEPNDVTDFGPELTSVERRPIDPRRSRRKGTVTNLESSVGFEADLTMDSFVDFAEGFVFARFANREFDLRDGGAAPEAVASNDTFVVDTVSTLLGGKLVYNASGAISLVYAKGYSNAANNGLFALSADVAPTDTAVGVTANLVDEAPTATSSASLQVAGVRVTDADLTLTVSGSTATLVSAADITNWATLGLFPGQYIHIGSPDANGEVQNALGTSAGAADDTFGYARIVSISGATLNLDKLDVNLGGTADNNGDGVCDILFGRFLRNVSTDANTSDNEFIERTFQFEGSYPNLGSGGATEYEYPEGNYCNEWALNLPLTDKATANWGFIGTNTDPITASRKTGPSDAIPPLRNTAVNTSQDIASISTDVVSSQSDVCFQSLTITLNNNVSPANCLGTLGAAFVNVGLFEVSLEGEMIFTRKEIVNAIRNNTTVTFNTILKNDDGAIAIDIPSLTFGGGARSFPIDETVTVAITGSAFNDPSGTIPDVSIGISLFPVVPTVRPTT
jgi:hypothetical protein